MPAAKATARIRDSRDIAELLKTGKRHTWMVVVVVYTGTPPRVRVLIAVFKHQTNTHTRCTLLQ